MMRQFDLGNLRFPLIFFAQNSSDYSYINFTNRYSKSIKDIYKNQKLKSKLISVKLQEAQKLREVS